MPKYEVEFYRLVTIRETVERVIEAENKAEAETIAHDMANGFDQDCPDDALGDGGGECGGWSYADGPFDVVRLKDDPDDADRDVLEADGSGLAYVAARGPGDEIRES